MSIALNEQVKSALYRIAKLEQANTDLQERVATLEKEKAERKKLGRPPLNREPANG